MNLDECFNCSSEERDFILRSLGMMPTIEKCPNCQQEHRMGDWKVYPEGTKKVASPPDITCSCGWVLRWFCPLYKVNQSGFLLRPKTDLEPIRQ